MNCPNCQATDTTRVAVAWEKETTVAVRGAGKPNSRRVGDLHQSLSAFKLSPPDRPKARMFLTIVLIVVGIAIARGITQPAPDLGAILVVAAFVVPIAWCILDVRKQRSAHVQAMKNWNRLWSCNRCGHVADDEDFRPVSQAPVGPLIEGGSAAELLTDH